MAREDDVTGERTLELRVAQEDKALDEAAAELEGKPVDEPVAEHEPKAEVVPEEDAAWEEGGDPSAEGGAAALQPPSCWSRRPLK